MAESIEPTSLDIIMLVHKATLELYGLSIQPEKSLRLASLLHEVAEGQRTFIDSDHEAYAQQLRAEFDVSGLGVTFAEFMQIVRKRERNAARRLAGLRLLE